MNRIEVLPDRLYVVASEDGNSTRLESQLRETCESCGCDDCCWDCPASAFSCSDISDIRRHTAAMHGLESLVLACAAAGLDVGCERFRHAVEVALESIDNNL